MVLFASMGFDWSWNGHFWEFLVLLDCNLFLGSPCDWFLMVESKCSSWACIRADGRGRLFSALPVAARSGGNCRGADYVRGRRSQSQDAPPGSGTRGL